MRDEILIFFVHSAAKLHVRLSPPLPVPAASMSPTEIRRYPRKNQHRNGNRTFSAVADHARINVSRAEISRRRRSGERRIADDKESERPEALSGLLVESVGLAGKRGAFPTRSG